MRKIVFALIVAAVFCLYAGAQDSKAPTFTLGLNGGPTIHGLSGITFDTLPSLCKPCVFYGGDYNANDPNSGAFADGNTLLVPDSAIYTAVDVPKNVRGVITGILFMQLATVSGGSVFDPATAPYDIRTGISEGNGGTSVASGTNALSYAPYMEVDGFEIYQTAVQLTKAFTVTPGTRYWFTVVPQCTDSGNSNCSELQYFFPNTTQETNGLNAGAQPPYEMFANSPFFGLNWENLCTLVGSDSPECARGSYGLMGHH
jgi:hypothetical protein